MVLSTQAIIPLLCLLHLSTSFRILSYTQHEQSYLPGQILSLTCKSDSAWEFCQWKHISKDQKARECLLEWKRAKGGVSVQTCDDSLTDRISISGDYDSHECGLTISALQLQDAGHWECEMEEYKFGDWASGDKHSKNMTVSVKQATTTTISPSTTTTLSTSTSPQQTTKASKIMTTSEAYEVATDDFAGRIEDNEARGIEEPNDNEEELIESSEKDESSEAVYTDDIEALPIEDRDHAEESSAGLIAGVLVAVSALVIVAILGAVWWKRKKKSMAIVALHMNKDDSLAANAFLEEAEYHISIIKDPEN